MLITVNVCWFIKDGTGSNCLMMVHELALSLVRNETRHAEIFAAISTILQEGKPLALAVSPLGWTDAQPPG